MLKKKFFFVFAIGAVGALALGGLGGCSKSKHLTKPIQTEVQTNSPRIFSASGIVRGLDAAKQKVTIQHEDIQGLMPSMTMSFDYKGPKGVLEKLKAGDGVHFELVVTKKTSWIASISQVAASSINLPTEEEMKLDAKVKKVNVGDPMPDFKLVDQENEKLTKQSFSGKLWAFTFFYTRCPLPNYCPLMSENFAKLQHKIAADSTLKGHVELLTISFDPKHDTPKVLARYAVSYTKNNAMWHFATGTPAQIHRLANAFSLYVKVQGGFISHGLVTGLVDQKGVVRKIWHGNAWDPNAVFKAMKELAKK